MLRQAGQPPKLDADDFRRTLPRFSKTSFDANAALFNLLDAVALEAEMSVPQVMLCWLLAQGGDIIPIPGARKIAHLEQNVAAVDRSLTVDQIRRLSEAFSPDAISGDRYTTGKSLKTA